MPVTKNHKESQKEKPIRADESANAHIKIPYNIKTHKNTVKMTPRGEKQLKIKWCIMHEKPIKIFLQIENRLTWRTIAYIA
jgi:hypothetical protein